MRVSCRMFALATAAASVALAHDAVGQTLEYRLLATQKTSTMQKELNQSAAEGFRFEAFMGGETSFGGNELVSVLSRLPEGSQRYEYVLLATKKTSTMQKEMGQAASQGYAYRDQSVAETMFGGREVVVIMERPAGQGAARYEYELLATNKTSTMQKELLESAGQGFVFKGVTVGSTSFGGNEVVAIMERTARP